MIQQWFLTGARYGFVAFIALVIFLILFILAAGLFSMMLGFIGGENDGDDE